MTLELDRRLLIKGATLGIGAMATPGFAGAMLRQGFTHGVASGEPGADSVLLWTRFASSNDTRLTAEVSDRADFGDIIAGGDVTARGVRDHTAKITLAGLSPDRWYYYRFIAPDGQVSPIGRTRTLPAGPTSRFNLGVFSCSNLPFGYFNAYAHAAESNNLDMVLHLGDYLYEYERGTYPSLKEALPGRLIQPDHEILNLADYRMRYGSYRADPDLQRLHQLYPMVVQWDDHELANDAWKGGAQNHDEAGEGDWNARKKAAEQVYREWMPVRDRAADEPQYTKYEIGDLATIFRTESRISGRDEPAELAAALRGQSDPGRALVNFRDTIWQDKDRSMLGAAQEKWLEDGFKGSKKSGKPWQIWAQQCVMGELHLPSETANWIPEDASPFVKRRAQLGVLAAQAGLPFNFDAWDGYPAARRKMLAAAQAADSDLIVLSGDSHNAWAFELEHDGRAAGVEFAGQSVTSPGFEAYSKGVDDNKVAAALTRTNDTLKWTDTKHRGYMTVSLTPDKVTSHFHTLATVQQKSTTLSGTKSFSVLLGARQMVAA